MSNTTSSFRIDQPTKEELSQIWGSVSAGATKAVEAYVNLRKRVLQDMKGYFSKDELTALVDNQNGTIFSPDLFSISGTWVHGVEDGIKYDGLDSRWNIDRDDLIEKLNALSDVQAYFMREEIDRFWSDTDSDLEEFVSKYC